jgi:nucleotide-binding universal stress UspA family protein
MVERLVAPSVRHMAQLALNPLGDHVLGDAQASAWTAVVGHDGSATNAGVISHAARRVGPDGYLIVVYALPLGVSATDVETSSYAGLARAVLRTIEAALPEDVSYEVRIVAGPASKALLDAARRAGADEIVLGASSGRAARGAVGRVADAVLRRSDRPVTIVPRGS